MNSYEELLKKAKESLPQVKATARFEMPRASLYVSKRQITIKNFTDIAKALRREPSQFARYLSKELAMPGLITGNEFVLNGKTSESLINHRINDFAKEFVLCEECKKPDTNIIKENKISILKCEACGARRPLRKI